jgi:hypothetical protein
MDRSLHIPLDFERRESVRLFHKRLLEARDASFPQEIDYTVLLALRIWIDWGGVGTDFRQLRHYCLGDAPKPVEWEKEDLTYVIECAAMWKGAPTVLILAAVESGFIRIESRPDIVNAGLVLDGFYPLNEHLSPDYQSIQKRGGHAAAARRLAKQSVREAKQRAEIFEQQGRLPFGAETASREEQEQSYALFIRLHRVCGLALPTGEKFTERAMRDALMVIRKFNEDQILEVETYLLASRDVANVVKVPEVILQNFASYLENSMIATKVDAIP